MKNLSNDELIRLYVHESANESSDHPFGAEARRKIVGDELLSQGISEFKLPAFGRSFPVKGSEHDATKVEYHLVTPGKSW